MTKTVRGAVLALPMLLCAVPAMADETDAAQLAQTDLVARGYRADAHGPAGTMGDHTHKRGAVMIGLSWMHESYGGQNRIGTQPIDDTAIAAAGYGVKAAGMTMDMAMLHLMWAPNDRVTLMAVPSWMRMGMTMQGLPGAAMSHGGMTLLPGQTMSHSAQGVGDTAVGALVTLHDSAKLSLHAGLMVSVPTGDVRRKNADGSYVHYMMQGGSGTWDLNPSLTLRGAGETFSWGLQTGYLFRAEKANVSGFRFGDRFTTTAWVAKPLTRSLSLSGRAQWAAEGALAGHYNAAHSHMSPPDRQANYGGKRLELGLGANLVVRHGYRIGAEATVPVYQRVNGIQLPKRFGFNLTANTVF